MLLNRRAVPGCCGHSCRIVLQRVSVGKQLRFLERLGIGSLQIGRPCDVLMDAGPQQAVYNLHPRVPEPHLPEANVQPGGQRSGIPPIHPPFIHWPLLLGVCSQDSDCAGQKRDLNNASDARCMNGYTCGRGLLGWPVLLQEALPLQKTSTIWIRLGRSETPVICNRPRNGCLE